MALTNGTSNKEKYVYVLKVPIFRKRKNCLKYVTYAIDQTILFNEYSLMIYYAVLNINN